MTGRGFAQHPSQRMGVVTRCRPVPPLASEALPKVAVAGEERAVRCMRDQRPCTDCTDSMNSRCSVQPDRQATHSPGWHAAFPSRFSA